MHLSRCLYPMVLLALAQPLLAGGTWRFQVVHTAKATAANEHMIWTVKFDLPRDKAEVRYRVWQAGSQETGNQDADGQSEKKLPANGQVSIPTNGSVVFTYDRSKCGLTTVNKGIGFLVMDYKGLSAAYRLEKSDTNKPPRITYLDEKSKDLAAKTRDVLKLTQGDKSNTGFTTIGILKDELRD